MSNPRMDAHCNKCDEHGEHYTRRYKGRHGTTYRVVRPCVSCCIKADAERYKRIKGDIDAMKKRRERNKKCQQQRIR